MGDFLVRTCRICGHDLPEESFYLAAYRYQGSGKQARNSYCIECEKKRQNDYYAGKGRKSAQERSWAKQGIRMTLDEYEQMLAAQGGACAICGSESDKSGRRLAVDHCHESGRVRGILCSNCNLAIGRLNDDPALLAKALAYLQNERAVV